MVRMQGPAGSGGCISAAGFTLFADDDGSFEVPQNIAAELQSHGFMEYVGRGADTVSGGADTVPGGASR